MRAVTIIAAVAVAGAFLLGLYKHIITKTLGTTDPAIEKAFQEWAVTFGKTYGTPTERNYRRSVFAQNVEKIAQYNKLYTHRSGLNHLSDLTYEEFLAKYTTTEAPRRSSEKPATKPSLAQAPSVDWRQKDAVNGIKNQGNCKASWAFATTAAIESSYKIAGNQLYNLAEQQIIDCSNLYGNQGCVNGTALNSYLYVKTVGGQMQTSDYPYTQQQGKCGYKKADLKAKISGFNELAFDNCHSLVSQLNFQPVSVGLAVSPEFQSYTSGIFNITTCGTTLATYATVVGYDTDPDTKANFWIIRNSWGANWGEAGYMRMDRSGQFPAGICGICQYGTYPTV